MSEDDFDILSDVLGEDIDADITLGDDVEAEAPAEDE